MSFLLDVNVLIALIDPAHVAHEDAHRWFQSIGHSSWATCPITENGVIRILSNPKYPNSPGSPAVVAQIVGNLHAPFQDTSSGLMISVSLVPTISM